MGNYRKKILVTGASGFIGKNLCDYLIKKGYSIRKMVHTNHLDNSIYSDSEIVVGDLTNLKSLIKATKDVGTVVNLAAKKSDEKDSYEVNVNGVKNLLKACEINSVSNFVQISSISTKIPKKGTYAETKAIADEIIASSKIPFIILRVSLVYSNIPGGVFSNLIKFSKLPFVPVFGNGTWISNPIHTDDLSKAIEQAIINPKLKNKFWDVGGKDSIKFDDLIRKIALTQGKNPQILHIPVAFGLILARLTSFLRNPPFTVSNILGSTQNVDLDIKSFIKNFNLRPITLDKGLKLILSGEDKTEEEAYILSRYILSLANIKFTPDKVFIKNYKKSLGTQILQKSDKASELVLKFPFAAGPVEVFLKILHPQAIFLKKLFIISALLEAHPITADWLLPKERGFAKLLKELFLVGIHMTIKYILGIISSPFLLLYLKNEKN